jgi:DNA-binding transcriptional LysR family regulator
MIEVRHLRYMVALAKEMNFTAAAKRMHVAQPALSQNIRQIEDELGVQLFERNTHKVKLTAAGKVFYREAVATLEHLERTARVTQRAAQGEAGVLSIGFTTTAMLGELPTRISNFRKQYPNIEVLFRELPLDLLVDALRIGALDIGCSDIDVIDEMLESAPLKAVPVVVVLNKAHRLARYSSLRLEMLATETFILPAPDSHHSLYNTFVQACREAGFEPIDPYFVDTIPAGLGLVSANIGITLQHRLPLFQCR